MHFNCDLRGDLFFFFSNCFGILGVRASRFCLSLSFDDGIFQQGQIGHSYLVLTRLYPWQSCIGRGSFAQERKFDDDVSAIWNQVPCRRADREAVVLQTFQVLHAWRCGKLLTSVRNFQTGDRVSSFALLIRTEFVLICHHFRCLHFHL